MERSVLQLTLSGLLLALAATKSNKEDWDIYSFHINSTVTTRYATTIITSRVANHMNESKNIGFQVKIPKNAFISKFRMLVGGQMYDGAVKSMEETQRQYPEAEIRRQRARTFSSVGRTWEEFKTSVSVAAHNNVTFELMYEELMKRTLGKYELRIYSRPMQPVKDFKVDVYIHEKAGISFVDVKGELSTNTTANAITKTHADTQAWVHFYPTEDQQKTCDSCSQQGMDGDLLIAYDVNRDSTLGDIWKSAGYFIHYFAPSNLRRTPKNVVFLFGQSSSRFAEQMQQTKTALIHTLNDLSEDDYFSLLYFARDTFPWKHELVQANSANLEDAKKFVEEIDGGGGCDMNKAILEGTKMLNSHPREGSASLLILLTDADPSTGESKYEIVQSNVTQAIAGKFPLYCLGFSFTVNFEFLEKMALQNDGAARRIYEGYDVDLQLKGFYEEVATPLLLDVVMLYSGSTNLTQTNFSQYYNGSEIVVAGQITDNNIETFNPQVVAFSGTRKLRFPETNTSVQSIETVSDDQIQRVWAYLTIEQLLKKEDIEKKEHPHIEPNESWNVSLVVMSGPAKDEVQKEVLDLSLKYSFLTPLTSMVVTKPPGENADVLDKLKELKRRPRRKCHGRPIRPGAGGRHEVCGPLKHRFLFSPDDQSLPLCFDVQGPAIFKILHQPRKELFVNGELDSVTNGGFKKIVIHYKNNHYVALEPIVVTVEMFGTLEFYYGSEDILAGNITVIGKVGEWDVTVGDVQLVFRVHSKYSKEFLWPVLRQKPSADNTEGILALQPAVYEEVHTTPTRLKIQGQEIDVTRDTAADYSNIFPVVKNCWLLPAQSALQRPLTDFIVARL